MRAPNKNLMSRNYRLKTDILEISQTKNKNKNETNYRFKKYRQHYTLNR